MRGCVRPFDILRAAAVVLAAAVPAQAAPQRVVSMNLCSDQLALMLAAPGQLLSVSNLAQDPRLSPVADLAAGLTPNRGRAEEIYLMRPDLVIAGPYGSAATVSLLRRLDIRVEILPPADDFATIRAQIRQMGAMLGRDDAATRLLAAFDAELAAATSPVAGGRAALYGANGITSGTETLAGAIVAAAGFRNIAADHGIRSMSPLPLELLVMARPDRLIVDQRWPGQSQGEAILDHPALDDIAPVLRQSDLDWTCGTPLVARAVRSLR